MSREAINIAFHTGLIDQQAWGSQSRQAGVGHRNSGVLGFQGENKQFAQEPRRGLLHEPLLTDFRHHAESETDMATLSGFIDIHENVLNALNDEKPIVAAVSTIATQGIPFPGNVDIAIPQLRCLDDSRGLRRQDPGAAAQDRLDGQRLEDDAENRDQFSIPAC